jgi:hypothetical protein
METIMESKVVKKIELENHQTLVISDFSRKISEDAYVVVMTAGMEIKIEPELFDFEPLTDLKLREIIGVLGDRVMYETRSERNFIMDDQKDEVFDTLVRTFMDNLGQYVARPEFPGKFVLKAYRDQTK